MHNNKSSVAILAALFLPLVHRRVLARAGSGERDAAGAASAPAAAAAAAAGANVEWREYGGNIAAHRYSPLAQINRDNVSRLEIAWTFQTGNYGPRPEMRNETTPLMIDGVLYTTVGITRNVVAIDPKTGETLWVWRAERRRAALRRGAAQDLGPRPVVLEGRRRQRAPDRRDAGVLSRLARSRHGPADAGLRRERRRRPHGRRARRGDGQDEHRQQLARARDRRRDRRRTRARGRACGRRRR